MKQHVEFMRRNFMTDLLTFVRWTVFSCVIGALVGSAGVGFHHAVAAATAWRLAHPALLFGLPLAGLAIVWLYHVCGMERAAVPISY